MRNKEQWKPTKFTFDLKGKLSAISPGIKPGSHFIANLTADKLQKKINLYARGHFLDLGCGYAPFFLVYGEKASEVTLIDWENSLHKNPYLDQVHDITTPLPLPDCSIDTLFMSDVLEHIPNPTDVFKEMSRVLRPNGYLIMNVPFAYPEHEIPHDYYRYTRFALERFAKTNGFEEINVEPVGDSLGVICDVLSKALMGKPVLNLIPKLLSSILYRRYEKNKFFMPQMPLGYVLTCKKI